MSTGQAAGPDIQLLEVALGQFVRRQKPRQQRVESRVRGQSIVS